MNRNKTISFGDKIFARVTRNGHTIFNFVSEKVANMTDLISQLRSSMNNVQGLVMIHIRNFHQGWGESRPLMLYAPKESYYAKNMNGASIPEISPASSRQMFFPWETH